MDQIHAIWCALSYLYMACWKLTMCLGFVLLQMYLAHYWNWNRGSLMSNMAGMVRLLRISILFKFIVTDQKQFQLWQSSQNLMI